MHSQEQYDLGFSKPVLNARRRMKEMHVRFGGVPLFSARAQRPEANEGDAQAAGERSIMRPMCSTPGGE